MAVDRNRIAYLLGRFSTNDLSEAEFDELCTVLADAENESAVMQRLFEDLQASPFTEVEPAKLDAVLATVLKREEAPVKRLIPGRRFAAAAVILVLVGAGAWLAWPVLTKSKNRVEATSTPKPTDFAPGNSGAVLTLEDGRQIVLENAADGQLGDKAVKSGNAVLYNHGPAAEVAYHTMTTSNGKQYSLVLADGSKVWLNAASSIRFPTAFTGEDRSVEITGEAYFEVAHDARKPFHVLHRGMDIKVLGTDFNVNAYTNESDVRTTLLQGSVQVSTAGKSVTIKPGEQALLRSGASSLGVVRGVDTEQVTAWKNGRFHFDGADLQTVMRQVERWYDVEVEYRGGVPAKTFKGEISRNVPASKVLQMLEYLGVRFEMRGKKIVVIP